MDSLVSLSTFTKATEEQDVIVPASTGSTEYIVNIHETTYMYEIRIFPY